MPQVSCGDMTTLWFSLTQLSENPWTAAQRFLEANELPASYLDEVAGFIQKNAAGVSLGGDEGQYSDPYTGMSSLTIILLGFPDVSRFRKGGSRYQPGGGSAANPNPGGDPFTGGSRYQPAVNTSVTSQAGGVDPFTGGSRYQPSPTPSGPAQGGYSDPFTGTNRYQATPSPAPSTPIPPTPSSSNVIPHVRLGVSVLGGDLANPPKLENANHLQTVQHSCDADEVDGAK